MTVFKQVGQFGIFAQQDILRAIPSETSTLDIRIENSPKNPLEEFRFAIVQKTLIQIKLIVKAMDTTVEETESFTDTTNERIAQKSVVLDEDNLLKFFAFTEEEYPNRTSQTEKLTPARAEAINFRYWMKRHRTFLRKQAEFDEAMAGLVATDNPEYSGQLQRALMKKPTDADTAEFPTLIHKMLSKLQEKLGVMVEDSEFIDMLASSWEAGSENAIVEAKTELLGEYMQTMFGSDRAIA